MKEIYSQFFFLARPHLTWTASIFVTLGHESFLSCWNVLLFTGISHSDLPKQYCTNKKVFFIASIASNISCKKAIIVTFSMTCLEAGALQDPRVKFPQVPVGFPKLANSTAAIFLVPEHLRLAVRKTSSVMAWTLSFS